MEKQTNKQKTQEKKTKTKSKCQNKVSKQNQNQTDTGKLRQMPKRSSGKEVEECVVKSLSPSKSKFITLPVATPSQSYDLWGRVEKDTLTSLV